MALCLVFCNFFKCKQYHPRTALSYQTLHRWLRCLSWNYYGFRHRHSTRWYRHDVVVVCEREHVFECLQVQLHTLLTKTPNCAITVCVKSHLALSSYENDVSWSGIFGRLVPKQTCWKRYREGKKHFFLFIRRDIKKAPKMWGQFCISLTFAQH